VSKIDVNAQFDFLFNQPPPFYKYNGDTIAA